jgi:hypothetical protein
MFWAQKYGSGGPPEGEEVRDFLRWHFAGRRRIHRGFSPSPERRDVSPYRVPQLGLRRGSRSRDNSPARQRRVLGYARANSRRLPSSSATSSEGEDVREGRQSAEGRSTEASSDFEESDSSIHDPSYDPNCDFNDDYEYYSHSTWNGN